jgi:chromosome segregation ATPase
MIDTETLLFAIGGAILLAGGGALLRPSVPRAKLEELEGNVRGQEEQTARLHRALDAAKKELEEAQKETGRIKAALDRAAADIESEKASLKKELATAKADLDRVEGDLFAERKLAEQMEASLTLVRTALMEAKAAAEARPAIDPAVVAELETTKAELAKVTEDRDAARSKVEALERLVEGVRLRSRELTKELNELKAKHGG